jgi:glucosamine 6-phosphate synthetase-like amidotransferase/phosphosugar isomerase protein
MSIEKIKARFPNGQLRTFHPFYMADEIKDIPGCLEACLDENQLYSIQKALEDVKPKRIFTVGCGTSYNACQAIAYTSRTLLNIPAGPYDAFDFQLDLPCGVDSQALVIFVSHSGQTLVTCLAQEKAKSLGAFTVGISGNSKSRLLKTVDLALTDPHALEVPFGKTRSYLSSCMQGMLAAIMTASPQIRDEFIIQAKKMVSIIRVNMELWEKNGYSIASQWAEITNHYMLAGFGAQKANADEIGLKIIEVLGESATSFSLEEFTHGPDATFRKDLGIFLLQTDERSLERALTIAKGVALSEAVLVVITDQMDAGWPNKAQMIRLPTLEKLQQLSLFPAAIASQYLMYFLAVKKGLIPDINCLNLHPELENVAEIFFPPGTH